MSETIKVRIAVAITPDGVCDATVVGRRSDDEARDGLLTVFNEPGTVVHFVTAELPKPTAPVTVEGTVER